MSGPTSRHSRWEPVDLVQHQIVSAVAARQQGVPRVMFKGGTLLRVCYRRDWRFSEDLDLDWIHADDTKPAIQDFFDRVLNSASRTYRTAFDTKWGAILDAVADATQHALDDYTATNTISHPDLRTHNLPPPNRPATGLGI